MAVYPLLPLLSCWVHFWMAPKKLKSWKLKGRHNRPFYDGQLRKLLWMLHHCRFPAQYEDVYTRVMDIIHEHLPDLADMIRRTYGDHTELLIYYGAGGDAITASPNNNPVESHLGMWKGQRSPGERNQVPRNVDIGNAVLRSVPAMLGTSSRRDGVYHGTYQSDHRLPVYGRLPKVLIAMCLLIDPDYDIFQLSEGQWLVNSFGMLGVPFHEDRVDNYLRGSLGITEPDRNVTLCVSDVEDCCHVFRCQPATGVQGSRTEVTIAFGEISITMNPVVPPGAITFCFCKKVRHDCCCLGTVTVEHHLHLRDQLPVEHRGILPEIQDTFQGTRGSPPRSELQSSMAYFGSLSRARLWEAVQMRGNNEDHPAVTRSSSRAQLLQRAVVGTRLAGVHATEHPLAGNPAYGGDDGTRNDTGARFPSACAVTRLNTWQNRLPETSNLCVMISTILVALHCLSSAKFTKVGTVEAVLDVLAPRWINAMKNVEGFLEGRQYQNDMVYRFVCTALWGGGGESLSIDVENANNAGELRDGIARLLLGVNPYLPFGLLFHYQHLRHQVSALSCDDESIPATPHFPMVMIETVNCVAPSGGARVVCQDMGQLIDCIVSYSRSNAQDARSSFPLQVNLVQALHVPNDVRPLRELLQDNPPAIVSTADGDNSSTARTSEKRYRDSLDDPARPRHSGPIDGSDRESRELDQDSSEVDDIGDGDIEGEEFDPNPDQLVSTIPFKSIDYQAEEASFFRSVQALNPSRGASAHAMRGMMAGVDDCVSCRSTFEANEFLCRLETHNPPCSCPGYHLECMVSHLGPLARWECPQCRSKLLEGGKVEVLGTRSLMKPVPVKTITHVRSGQMELLRDLLRDYGNVNAARRLYPHVEARVCPVCHDDIHLGDWVGNIRPMDRTTGCECATHLVCLLNDLRPPASEQDAWKCRGCQRDLALPGEYFEAFPYGRGGGEMVEMSSNLAATSLSEAAYRFVVWDQLSAETRSYLTLGASDEDARTAGNNDAPGDQDSSGHDSSSQASTNSGDGGGQQGSNYRDRRDGHGSDQRSNGSNRETNQQDVHSVNSSTNDNSEENTGPRAASLSRNQVTYEPRIRPPVAPWMDRGFRRGVSLPVSQWIVKLQDEITRREVDDPFLLFFLNQLRVSRPSLRAPDLPDRRGSPTTGGGGPMGVSYGSYRASAVTRLRQRCWVGQDAVNACLRLFAYLQLGEYCLYQNVFVDRLGTRPGPRKRRIHFCGTDYFISLSAAFADFDLIRRDEWAALYHGYNISRGRSRLLHPCLFEERGRDYQEGSYNWFAECDYLFFPVHWEGNHFMSVIVETFRGNQQRPRMEQNGVTVHVYDSLISRNQPVLSGDDGFPRNIRHEFVSDVVKRQIADERTRLQLAPVPINTLYHVTNDQGDGYTCGLRVVVVAWALLIDGSPPARGRLREIAPASSSVDAMRPWIVWNMINDHVWLPTSLVPSEQTFDFGEPIREE